MSGTPDRVLGLLKKNNKMPVICCQTMDWQMKDQCEQHGIYCPDKAIKFSGDQFFIVAPNSTYNANYCPWCGSKLKLKD